MNAFTIEIIKYWHSFIVGFCKVEFLCYAKEPNWLGVAVIGVMVCVMFFACMYFLFCVMVILYLLFLSIYDSLFRR